MFFGETQVSASAAFSIQTKPSSVKCFLVSRKSILGVKDLQI